MHGRKLTGLSLLYYLESVEIHGVIAITFNQRRQNDVWWFVRRRKTRISSLNGLDSDRVTR